MRPYQQKASRLHILSFNLLLMSLAGLSNGVYVSLCVQNTNVQIKPQNIVEETQAPESIKQSPDRFLKYFWLLTVFPSKRNSSDWPAETQACRWRKLSLERISF